jgi:thiamine-phosphate pyrophosphorylase
MITIPDYGLYAITDCKNLSTDNLIEKTELILQSGAKMLQYRNKLDKLSIKEFQAIQLQHLCHKYKIPFIINDDINLAQKIRADGVHLGRNDKNCKEARILLGPDYIIGVSCYNELNRAVEAELSGASYIAFGAFFPTKSKRSKSRATTALLKLARQKLALPIVAIGGITPENGKKLLRAGADFIAAISGIYEATNPVIATRAYHDLFNFKQG